MSASTLIPLRVLGLLAMLASPGCLSLQYVASVDGGTDALLDTPPDMMPPPPCPMGTVRCPDSTCAGTTFANIANCGVCANRCGMNQICAPPPGGMGSVSCVMCGDAMGHPCCPGNMCNPPFTCTGGMCR